MKSLDAFLPAYEFSTRHAVPVAADPVRMVVLRAAKRRAEAV